MSKSESEDNDTPLSGATNIWANNAIYFEPSGTSWNQIYDQLSERHRGGAIFAMLDTSAKWRNVKWVHSRQGKIAFNPLCADVPDGTGWSNAGNCLNTTR